MSYKLGRLSYDWDLTKYPDYIPLENVTLDGKDLKLMVSQLLSTTRFDIVDQFKPSKQIVVFPQQIIEICNEVFSDINQSVGQDPANKVPMAYMASRLFEGFSHYWMNSILPQGLHIFSTGFWKEVLRITNDWETGNNNFQIHKGTPYYFLAESYFLLGDKDSGFFYLFNGLEDNKNLPELGYPKTSPSFLTATMSRNLRNQMYEFIIKELRYELSQFINKFQMNYDQNFTIDYFDKKFIENDEVINTVYFFVYNFFNLNDLNKNTIRRLLANEFSRLKALDLFFNLGLIIDEILTLSASKNSYNSESMGDSVKWYVTRKLSVVQSVYDNLIGVNGLNLRNGHPKDVIPKLLSNIQNTNKIVRETNVMLLALYLRNHAGHNLDQQDILISNFDQIIDNLFMSIFLAVKTL